MMLQPFLPFRFMYIERLLALGKRYLVAQSYPRGTKTMDGSTKTGILLTDYDDAGLAKTHCHAVRQDRFACVIDLENHTHVSKICDLMKPRSKYLLYWSVVASAEEFKKNIMRRYADNVRRYVQGNTEWHIGAAETIRPCVQVIFGELFMILKRGSHELRVKFSDVERC